MVKTGNQSNTEHTSSLVSPHRCPGVNQPIQDHNVEHREDIEGIWASGFHKPDPFLTAEDTEREKWGDASLWCSYLSPEPGVGMCRRYKISSSPSYQHSSTHLLPTFRSPSLPGGVYQKILKESK